MGIQAEQLLTELDQLALLVASIAHDLGHIGLTNSFLIEVQHELAMRYNDRSPLENMHCSKLFEIFADPSVNILSATTKDQYKEMRKPIIDTILHTDITQHPDMVKGLDLLYEMNSKVFQSSDGNVRSDVEIEVFSAPEAKKLVMQMLLHGADISNPSKPWPIAFDWAHRVLDEYANQGDQEKQLGVPVQVLNDREKLNRPSSQIGFIEFIITPFIVSKLKLFRSLSEVADILNGNVHRWEKSWVEETNPVEAEREKVKDRIEKISTALQSVGAVAPSALVNSQAKRRRSLTA